jgi:hypothetical protein
MDDFLGRAWEQLVARTSGPMALRFVLQPTVATIFAIRAGLKDARTGQPPYLWTVFSDPAARKSLLRQGWKDIGKLFIVATLLDSVYQILVLRSFHPLSALMVASALAIVPYVVIRGPVSRLARRGPERRGAA